MFQSVDQNKNGVIDMEEFMEWVRPGGVRRRQHTAGGTQPNSRQVSAEIAQLMMTGVLSLTHPCAVLLHPPLL